MSYSVLPEISPLLNAIPIPQEEPKARPISLATPHDGRPLTRIKKFFRKVIWRMVPCVRKTKNFRRSYESTAQMPVPVVIAAEKPEGFQWEEECRVYKTFNGEEEEYQDIKLGDKLGDGKYKVVRKLGYGANGTVWLAKVNRLRHLEYVAVKVLTTESTREQTASIGMEGICHGEWSILDDIRLSRNRDHPGWKHCSRSLADPFLRLSSTFPDALHLCLVLPLVGSTVDDLQIACGGQFPVPIAKRITKQLLLALSYLHDVRKIIHTDIKPDNMAVSIGYDPQLIKQYLDANPPQAYPARFCPEISSKPFITYKTQPLPDFGLNTETLENICIKLMDFGSCRRVSDRPRHPATPVILRAPEIALGGYWSTPIDIWTLGCNVFYFLCGYRYRGGIFCEPDIPDCEDNALEECKALLGQIEAHVGEIPESLILLSPQRDLFYDCKTAVKKFPRLTPSYTIRDLYEIFLHPGIDDEKEATVAFIRRCLTIDPNKRPTAKELLDDPWLNEV